MDTAPATSPAMPAVKIGPTGGAGGARLQRVGDRPGEGGLVLGHDEAARRGVIDGATQTAA